MQRRSSVPADRIAATVFVDGIPRFPEHYLMHVYRPELVNYQIDGPLEIAAEFFNRISLRTLGGDRLLEVSGGTLAEALILSSYSGASEIALPRDERLLADLVMKYRCDLQQLWDRLVRECRRCQPRQQAATKLAKTIWRQHGLPPEKLLRADRTAAG